MVKLNIPRPQRTVEQIDQEIAPLQARLSKLLEERAAAAGSEEPPIAQQVKRFYAEHPGRLKKDELVTAMAKHGYWLPAPEKRPTRYDEAGRLSRAIAAELSLKSRRRLVAQPALKLDRNGCVIPADWDWEK